MSLSDLTIKKLKAKPQRYEVADTKGLYIRITPAGAKSWIFRYVIDGVPRRMTLGRYPGLSLAQAREAHAKAIQEVQQGIDPGRKKQEAKRKRKEAPTVAELVDEFWEVELKDKRSGIETKRLLMKDVVPAWGKRKAADIKRRDVVLLLDHVRGRAPIGANRLLGALSRMFNLAAERGIIDDSPCTRIRKPQEKGRSRVLSDDEIRLLWKALDLENKEVDMYHVSKLAMKLVLITGQRPGEVCGMTWDELKEDGFWNIPASRMKGGVDHRIPLPRLALDMIEQARPYSSGSDYVFISPQSPHYSRRKPSKANKPREEDAPMTAHALSRALVRHWTEMGFDEKTERFTPHDLRRTLRTRLASLGVTDVIGERVLGHKLQGVLAVYNRYDYDQEKRHALERWERELRRIVGIDAPEPGKVVQLRKKGNL